ncbi:hypothetical protein EDB19DRAFT_1897642 [Suillus lakei]|nr:hypothetical protein EDB19DRAFT_1897642 [Suillus lakei]
MLDKLEDNEYAYQHKENPYYPFQDEGEWQLGKFLVENLTQTQISKFLKLTWVTFDTHARPSFTSKDQLIGWMDILPCFMEGKVSKIEFTGYKTTQPIELIWCDGLDVIKQLFSDPTFANHMKFDPHIVQVGDQCEYGSSPCGRYSGPIILGSDKTPVIQVTGGLEMHPVSITITISIPKFALRQHYEHGAFKVHPEYQTIPQAIPWHKCMDLIFANLKTAAASMIAAVSKNASPLTMATQKEFGDGTLHPPRTGLHTLQLIVDISRTVDPWDLDKFQKAAKAAYLSGVHMPFWRDWIEILHTGHKFFFDHPLNWVKETHKWIRTRHFTKGVTHVKQMTGCEHRDIQHTIVASIAGAAPPRFIHAIRSLVDFIYLAQNLSMAQALSDFHSLKDTIVDTQARRGKNGAKEDFFIPKLKLLQSFCGTVERLGSLMQFLADVTECLLITHCKDLFNWTSWQSKDFALQCVQILNQQETMEMFDLFALLHSCVLPDETKSVHGPRPVCNHFLKGILSGDALTAFQLNISPDYKSLSSVEIHTKYLLPDFNSAGESTLWDGSSGCFCTWNKFRLQLHSAFQPRIIMPSRVIQAYSPSDDFPLGNCDTILIETMGDDGQMSMYTVERTFVQDNTGNCYREGAVVQITDVTHAVELIPCFGEKAASDVSLATCLECYERFFLNNFTDKESYHTFSTEYI